MSAVTCNDCGLIFSADDDPDCFIYVGERDEIAVCETCREELDEDKPNYSHWCGTYRRISR